MSNSPSLLEYKTAQEYQEHYKAQFCKQKIVTADGMQVYFSEGRFWHAFCTRDEKGKKTDFSFERAKYINWIRPTLEQPNAILWQGWNSDKQYYEPDRRVSIVYQGFIVVIQIKMKKDGFLKADFITAFYDKKGNAVAKINNAPIWKKDECIEYLKGEKE